MVAPKGRPPVYDRDALYRYLWDRSDSEGLIELNQTSVSEQLGCTRQTMKAMLDNLQEARKIKLVDRPGRTTWLLVTDPDVASVGRRDPNGNRVIMWG